MALGAWRCLLGVESPQVGDVVVVRWARIEREASGLASEGYRAEHRQRR